MNNIWILLVVAFFLQENFVVNFALLRAKIAGINWIPITIIWLVMTVFDIVIPYWLTLLLYSRISYTKLGMTLNVLSEKANRVLHRKGRLVGLILLGIFASI